MNVLNAVEMNNFFVNKWNAMKDAFANNEIDTAASYYTETSKQVFHDQLAALAPYRDQITKDMVAISLVRFVDDTTAECELLTVKDGVTYSFQVLYVLDSNGNWGIHSY